VTAGLIVCLGLTGCSSTAQSHVTTGNPAVILSISNFIYSPNPLTVTPGAVIGVTNKDDTAHTVTAFDGAFSTGNIGPTRTVTFVAPTAPGTYQFRCTIHPKMLATLVVR
jgi:plastocyanin